MILHISAPLIVQPSTDFSDFQRAALPGPLFLCSTLFHD
jgi:hypothetical protein